jgi:hypothetical protein
MFSVFRIQLRLLVPGVLTSVIFACLGGCAEPHEKSLQVQQPDLTELSKKLGALNSTSPYLLATDLNNFRPGRAKVDILKDIKWRGYFYMATEYEEKAICAIIYDLLSEDPKLKGGVGVWAIFVDGKFVKFVKPPASLPSDKEVVDHGGTSWNRTKPMKAGDDRFLIRAMNAEPVTIDELKKEVTSLTAPPESIDPGLTIAYLLLRAMGAAAGPEPRASEKDYLRNAALRDQFNAARLHIGMTRADVGATLKAEPLETGKVESGEYAIYGSNESFDVDQWLHFSNILVIYRNGKAITISSVPAGHDWRGKLAESTTDLPKPSPVQK